nr:hypothetical protein JVH1_7441 [Rhodococcus sp. JVH1]
MGFTQSHPGGLRHARSHSPDEIRCFPDPMRESTPDPGLCAE